MSKVRIRLLLLAVVIAVALCGIFVFVARYPRSRAERLLADISGLSLNRTTFEEARSVTTAYGGHNVGPCTREKCRYDITVSNRILYWLGLSKLKQFGVTLVIEDNRVDRISFAITCSPVSLDQYPLGTGVSVKDEACYPCFEGQRPFLAKQNGVDPMRPAQIIVELTGASTQLQRRAAYALDLSCLSDLGDCPRPEKVTPTIWRDIRSGRGE